MDIGLGVVKSRKALVRRQVSLPEVFPTDP